MLLSGTTIEQEADATFSYLVSSTLAALVLVAPGLQLTPRNGHWRRVHMHETIPTLAKTRKLQNQELKKCEEFGDAILAILSIQG